MKKNHRSAAGHAICLTLLLALCAIFLIAAKTLHPDFILPRITVTSLVGLCLAAQVLGMWVLPHRAPPSLPEAGLLSGLAFAVITWSAGYAVLPGALWVGLAGGVTYMLCLLLLTALDARLEDRGNKKLLLTLSAALLLLAAQSLAGIPILP